jgi:SAM-dependent methyltransferase
MRFLSLAFLLLSPATLSQTAEVRPVEEVPFVVTPPHVVERMLQLADVNAADRLVDLGSGDGRIVIAAAQRGAFGRGLEIDDSLVKFSKERAKALGLERRAEFLNQDIFEASYSEYSVVTMYLLPEFNQKLRPKLLRELKPGARIVSHEWDMGAWEPDELLSVRAPTKPLGIDKAHRVYLWLVPAQVSGGWRFETQPSTANPAAQFSLNLSQIFQKIEVKTSAGEVPSFTLRGEEIEFLYRHNGQTWRLKGRVSGSEMIGTMGRITEENGSIRWKATRN